MQYWQFNRHLQEKISKPEGKTGKICYLPAIDPVQETDGRIQEDLARDNRKKSHEKKSIGPNLFIYILRLIRR